MLYVKDIDIAWNHHNLGKISGCFYEGQISLIVGDNGIGKTTLLYSLALLKKVQGIYVYNDVPIDLTHCSITKEFRYRYIFVLLQELALFDDMYLKDYLDLMSGNTNRTYDITFPLNKKISDFSLGEKQYILIYGGFLQDKAIYLLDEPTSALDKKMKLKVFDLLNQLKRKGKIIIVVSHDQDLMEFSDSIYELKNQQLILKKQSLSSIKNANTNYNLLKRLIIKTRFYSPSFLSVIMIVVMVSLIFVCIGSFLRDKENVIEQELVDGQRQYIIVYDLKKPDIDVLYCDIEEYYSYEYEGYTFINQALPHSVCEMKKMNLNNQEIEYYQKDSIHYVKKIYPFFKSKQVGYLISFDDVSLYPAIMKQLTVQYSNRSIQSLYLEKETITTLQIEKTVIMNAYYGCTVIMILLIAIFYSKKAFQQNMNYILMLDILGITIRQKVFLLLIELMLLMFLSYIILWGYLFEWFALCLFIFVYYTFYVKYLYSDFAYLYRTVYSNKQ